MQLGEKQFSSIWIQLVLPTLRPNVRRRTIFVISHYSSYNSDTSSVMRIVEILFIFERKKDKLFEHSSLSEQFYHISNADRTRGRERSGRGGECDERDGIRTERFDDLLYGVFGEEFRLVEE